MTIFVRDDDVLIDSSGHADPVGRFKQVHDWIKNTPGFVHVPAILVHNVIEDGTEGIEKFPEAIDLILEGIEDGSMRPEIHGWEHVDYGKKTLEEVMDDISRAEDWIITNLGVQPTTWYTPWGASQPHLHEAADLMNLQLVDCSRINKLEGTHGIVQRLKDGESLDFLEDQEIFMHWWSGGSRLLRVCMVARHGSWEAAVKADPKLFR